MPAFHRLVVALVACLAVGDPGPRAADDDYETYYPFRAITENPGSYSRIVLHNDGFAPIYAKLSFTEQQNVDPRGWPLRILVPPRTRLVAATVYPADPRGAYRFNYRFDYQFGDPQAKHDARAVYRVPFPPARWLGFLDRRFVISQAYPPYPGSTHDQPHSLYDIDVDMPVGTPVLAARAGQVVQVVQHWEEGKPDKAYLYKSNLVRILHDDGTLAEYLHLLKNSVPVRPGSRVSAGDLIGRSGNSGYSARPHLHLGVARAQAGGASQLSLPFKLRLKDGSAYTPKAGDALVGY